MAQADEEVESALLIACTNVNIEPTPSTLTKVHLNEPKLFVQLGDKQGREST
jgi:hypothetical protein